MHHCLGQNRSGTVTQTLIINQLYDQTWLTYDLFQHIMRPKEKTICPLLMVNPNTSAATTAKRYLPQPPLQSRYQPLNATSPTTAPAPGAARTAQTSQAPGSM